LTESTDSIVWVVFCIVGRWIGEDRKTKAFSLIFTMQVTEITRY